MQKISLSNKNKILTKFENILMKNGKKSKIERIITNTLQLIGKIYKNKENSINIIEKAINLIEPTVELKSIKIAGLKYEVPFEIQKKRQQSLAIRSLIKNINKRSEKDLTIRITQEIIHSIKKKSLTFKEMDTNQRKAEINRAFVHYRW